MSADKKAARPIAEVEPVLDHLIATLSFNTYNLDNYDSAQRKIENLTLHSIASCFKNEPLRITATPRTDNQEDSETKQKIQNDFEAEFPPISINPFTPENTDFNFLTPEYDQEYELACKEKKDNSPPDVKWATENRHKPPMLIKQGNAYYFLHTNLNGQNEIAKLGEANLDLNYGEFQKELSKIPEKHQALFIALQKHYFRFEKEYPIKISKKENPKLYDELKKRKLHFGLDKQLVINAKMKLIFYFILRNIIGTKKPVSIGDYVKKFDEQDQYAAGASGEVGPTYQTVWEESNQLVIGTDPTPEELKTGIQLLNKVKAENPEFYQIIFEKHIQRLICDRYYDVTPPQYTTKHEQALRDFDSIIGKNGHKSLIDEFRNPYRDEAIIQHKTAILEKLITLEDKAKKHNIILWNTDESPQKFKQKLEESKKTGFQLSEEVCNDLCKINSVLEQASNDPLKNIEKINQYLKTLEDFQKLEAETKSLVPPIKWPTNHLPSQSTKKLCNTLLKTIPKELERLKKNAEAAIEKDSTLVETEYRKNTDNISDDEFGNLTHSFNESKTAIDAIMSGLKAIEDSPNILALIYSVIDKKNEASQLMEKLRSKPERKTIFGKHYFKEFLDNPQTDPKKKLQEIRTILLEDRENSEYLIHLLNTETNYKKLKSSILNEFRLEQEISCQCFQEVSNHWENQFCDLGLNKYYLDKDGNDFLTFLNAEPGINDEIKTTAKILYGKYCAFNIIQKELSNSPKKNLTELIASRKKSLEFIKAPETQKILNTETSPKIKWFMVIGALIITGGAASLILTLYSKATIGTWNFFRVLTTTKGKATAEKAFEQMGIHVDIKEKYTGNDSPNIPKPKRGWDGSIQ